MSNENNSRQHYAQPGRKGFLPGNPGRQLGVKNKFSRETMEAVQNLSVSAITMLQTKIAQGDMSAISFVLSRCVPAGRTISIDEMTAANIAELARDGHLTADELKSLAGSIAKLREIDDLDEMRKRLEELERMVRQ